MSRRALGPVTLPASPMEVTASPNPRSVASPPSGGPTSGIQIKFGGELLTERHDPTSKLRGETPFGDTVVEQLEVLQRPRAVGLHDDVEAPGPECRSRRVCERRRSAGWRTNTANEWSGPVQKCQTEWCSPGLWTISAPCPLHVRRPLQGCRPSGVGQTPRGKPNSAPGAM